MKVWSWQGSVKFLPAPIVYMRIGYLVILSLFTVQQALCQDRDDRKMARSLNGQVSLLLSRLDAVADSAAYYAAVADIARAALTCDEYDARPDRKGRVKPKYRLENRQRVGPLLSKIEEAGFFNCRHIRKVEALRDFELFVECSASRLFEDQAQSESAVGQASYYAGLLAYETKDFAKADRYADVALNDIGYAKAAAEIKILCMKAGLTNETDSTRYLIALLELHDKDPDNRNYMRLLQEYFSSPGHEEEMGQFASDEIRKDARNVIAWLLLGETCMRRHEWDGAIQAYKTANELDSASVAAIYNIGICYSSKAIGIRDSLSEAGRLSDEHIKMVRRYFENARDFLERVASLDPQRKHVDWAKPLYQVYYVLDDERAEQIKGLIK